MIINQIVKKVDCQSRYDLPGRSNYEDFEQTMTSIFQMVEDYDIMVKKDHRQEQVASKMICRMFQHYMDEKPFLASSPEKVEASVFKYQSGLRHSKKQEISDYFQKKEEYKDAVREYTSYSVSRKVPPSISIFNQKEIESMNITFKSPTILRILSKWCNQLLQKFANPNYFQNQSIDIDPQRTGDVSSLMLDMRKDLDHLMQEEKKQIDRFMHKINQNNYKMQELLLDRKRNDYQEGGHEFIDQMEWATSIFSLDMIKNFQNYLVSYLNRLIHGLLSVSKRFYEQHRQNEIRQFSQPPNLLTFTLNDLMRCKITSRQKQIMKIFEHLKKLSANHPKRFSILQVKNRLDASTHDITLMLLFNNEIISQVQLAVASQISYLTKVNNQFEHYLYQLERSPFGPLVEICHVWVNLDNRFEIYQQIRNKSANMNVTSRIEKDCMHVTFAYNDPFICGYCKQAYSYNFHIKEHQKCSKCQEVFCMKCLIYYDLSKDPKKVLRANVIDDDLRRSCRRPFTLQDLQNNKKFPNSGVCIELEAKIRTVQVFQTISYQNRQFLLGKRNDKIYEIDKIGSRQLAQNFLSKYIVFERQGEEIVEKQAAIVSYIIPTMLKNSFRSSSYKIMISENLRDFDLDNIFSTLEPFHLQGLKQLMLDNNNIKSTQFIVERKMFSLQLLELSKNQIQDLQGIERLSQLKYLFLYDCGLTNIPDGIFQLSNLQKLRLCNNKISKISSSIGKLGQLRVLKISCNNLTELPDELSKCKKLSVLRCERNQNLKKIPACFMKLQSLQDLSVGFAKLDSFDPELCKLVNLSYLNLKKNKLTSLPQNFCKLQNLEELNLARNDIQELKITFKGLSKLKKLLLSENKSLSLLPKGLKDCKAILELDLQKCKFTAIPIEVTQLENLKMFNISHNQITEIGKNFQYMISLEIVDLSYNKIRNIDGTVYHCFKNKKELQEINLSHNQINQVPNFEFCKRLKKIIISHNNLNHMNDKKNGLLGLYQLQYFDASHNKIQGVACLLTPLPSLVSIDLSDNQISAIDQQNFPDQNQQYWPSLEALDLSNNRFEKIPDLGRFCPSLKTLILKSNQIIQLPRSVQTLKRLQELDISGNQISYINNLFVLANLKKISVKSEYLKSLDSETRKKIQERNILCDL